MGQKDGEKWTAAVDLQPTLPKSDRLLKACFMNTTRPTPDKETIALLPEFPRLGMGQIRLVETAAQAREACAALREHSALGFDTESKPTFVKDQVSEGPHTVQLSTLSQAWVFQLHEAGCKDIVAQLLSEPERQLAGFGLGDDNKRILAKLGVVPLGALELNTLFRERGYRKDMGVKGAIAVLFNQRFIKSKKAATSNWANSRLSESQLVYAANDAYAAACVYKALEGGALR